MTKKQTLLISLLLSFLLLLCSCAPGNSVFDFLLCLQTEQGNQCIPDKVGSSEKPFGIDEVEGDERPGSIGFDISYGDRFLASDETMQYYWRFVGNDCVLSAIPKDGSPMQQLAVFPPADYPSPQYTAIYRNYIVSFGVCDDWLIASVGHYEGSAHYFVGDFVRMRKDGSELEHFWITSDTAFVVVDDWIYYNYSGMFVDGGACYRIRPDGSDKEYLGDTLYSIILYHEDGYVYGTQKSEGTVGRWNPILDLIRCKPDGSDITTLFYGDRLPKFEESDYIGYSGIRITNDTIIFTVFVHGNTQGDSWRGRNLYVATYKVNKDGSNLMLLSEEYHV